MKIFHRRIRVGLAAACLALTSAGPAAAQVDAALSWNEAIGRFLNARGAEVPPHVQARAYAMTHLAIEQAILGATEAGRPIGAPETARQAAATCAAHDVLVQVLPAGAIQFDQLADDQFRELACDAPTKTRALGVGREAAALVLRKRESDRWTEPTAPEAAVAALRASLEPSRTPARPEATSRWSAATPFVVKSVGQFNADPPKWYDLDGKPQINAGLTRARIFDKVDRTTPPTTLVQFWSESPVVAWNRVAREVAQRSGLDPAGRARLLAVTSLAIADATIASLHWRAIMNRWTSHREQAWMPSNDAAMAGDVSVSIDGVSTAMTFRSETRDVMDAPVRDYPSVAATVAAAASSALTGTLGAKLAVLELAGPLPALSARTYVDLTAAARECAFASSLDGRHCREACVAGYRLGESIGTYVAKQARSARR